MFYLNQFFQIFKQYPVRFLAFFITTGILFFTASHRDFVASKLGLNTQVQMDRPYFHALIPSQQNTSWLARKLRELPGVDAVEILPEQALNKQVKELLSGMEVDVIQAVGAMQLAGLKVIARPELEERSIELIKDYLIRLAGKETTVGATVLALKNTKKTTQTWQRFSVEIILACILFVWFASVAMLMKPLRRTAYLVEQFQRRRGVALKTWSIALSFACAIGVGVSFILSKPQLLSLAICLAVALLSMTMYSRKVSWEG